MRKSYPRFCIFLQGEQHPFLSVPQQTSYVSGSTTPSTIDLFAQFLFFIYEKIDELRK